MIAVMHASAKEQSGFKRQVVFRLGTEDWPLLESAVAEHGSIQAAVVAGLRALAPPEASPDPPADAPARSASPPEQRAHAREPTHERQEDAAAEISAREAAQLLELKASTVRGYIRAGKLDGRYDGSPSWGGWLTTVEAVERYRRRRG